MVQQLLADPAHPPVPVGRATAFTAIDPMVEARLRRLLPLAQRGLRMAYLPGSGELAQTVRAVRTADGVGVRREGTSLRYAAITALGVSRLPVPDQQSLLAGRDAADLAFLGAHQALNHPDLGAVALSAWAAAEIRGADAEPLLRRLDDALAADRPLTALELSWTLTAAVAAASFADTEALVRTAVDRLLRHQGPSGLFTHVLPANGQPRWRAHVGSFADQVYPLQALARAGRHTGSEAALEAANRTAARICSLQGPAGQWWWHYDARDGRVVEAYPVYSVHQHAMAPMVLLDLWECGGDDHRGEVAAGLAWLDRHPEVVEELCSDRFGLVWRKVGRREPRKAARALGAVATSLRPGLRVPALDRLLPPVVVDHECRPYELGWLLYAWLPAPGSGRERSPRPTPSDGGTRG